MARQRDYKAEYARRIEKGLSKGLSRSQARGHPRPKEALASGGAKVPKYDQQLETAVKQIRNGKSLKGASASVGVSAERVRSYLTSQGIGEKVGGRWRVGKDSRIREMLLFSNGEQRAVTVRGYKPARWIGEYMAAVSRFLDTNDSSFLKPFVGKSVSDASRQRHPFETDENTLYRLASGGADDFSRIYRIQM